MAIPHAQPGVAIDVHPLADELATSKTRTLFKTPHMEVIRMVLGAGRVLAEHQAPGEIIVQCVEGRLKFTAMGKTQELRAASLLYLMPGIPHAVEAVEDSSFLLTILLPNDA